MKLRGYYSPRFFIPVLKETVQDPSPVIYGEPGGPERERTLATSLTDAQAEGRPGVDERQYAREQRVEWWDRAESKLANPDVDYPDYPDGPAAFACTRNYCSLPVTDPAAISAQIDRLRRRLQR